MNRIKDVNVAGERTAISHQLNIAGSRITVHDSGAGHQRPVAVFLHGNSQNHTCGEGLLSWCRQLGYRTLSYDLPGHGASPPLAEDYHFADLIEWHGELLEHFNLLRPLLIGHSLGGMIQAGWVAAEQRKDARLLLINSFDRNPLSEDHDGLVQAALDSYLAANWQRFKHQRLVDYSCLEDYDDTTIEGLNQCHTDPHCCERNLTTLNGFDVRQALIDLDVPLLMLHARDDPVIPGAWVETMAQAYSRLTLAWYEQGGHYAWLKQPRKTQQMIIQHSAQWLRG